MTGSAVPRVDPPFAAGEASTLSAFLEYLRATVLRKAEGLDSAQLAQTLAPSTMTLGGLLKHLAYVEDWWCGEVFAGQPAAAPWDAAPWADDVDWDWHSARDDSPEHLRALLVNACERSRTLIGGQSLDSMATLPSRTGERIALRWIMLHLIEEYARHCGHADLLRESIDGSTGD